jgi:hypothetical protein
VESVNAPDPDNPHAAWWFLQSGGTPARDAKGHALAHIQEAVLTGCSARTSVSWRRDVHTDVARKFSIERTGLMKKTNVSKSREQELAKVINQMDGWIQDKTRLLFSINTPLFHLFLRGRIGTHQEGLFLFDSYGGTCRIPVIPERYDHVVCDRKSPASVTLEKSAMQGSLEMREDEAEPMLEEICANWTLAKIVADAAS